MKKIKRQGLLLVGLIAVLLVSGCGASSGSYKKSASNIDYTSADAPAMPAPAPEPSYMMDMSADYGMAEDYKYEESKSGSTQPAEQVVDLDRKLIKTVNMDVETKQFDDLVAMISARIDNLGGYIENSSIYNGSILGYNTQYRYANFTIRIPQNNLDFFVDAVSENANVTNKSRMVEDVTLQYVDIEARKIALVTEQERLLELLKMAENMDDIILIEDKLSDVRYQLQSIESQLRTFDNQVNYSTVYMYVKEVKDLTPVAERTVGERIFDGFNETLNDIADSSVNFFVWFVVNLPLLLIWAVVIVVIILIIRALIRRGRKGMTREQRKAAKLAKKQERAALKAAKKAGIAKEESDNADNEDTL